MRIVAVSDLHIPKRDGYMSSLVKKILEGKADVLILGGDITAANDEALRRFLKELSGFKGHKLCISGNHDLWVTNSFDAGDSLERFRNVLPGIYKEFDFKSLEVEPVIVDDVAFVGNIGWYDYSYGKQFMPPSGTSFIRYDAENDRFENKKVPYSELNFDDWQNKQVKISGFFGLSTSCVSCNDRDYITGIDDVKFCEELAEKLDKDMLSVKAKGIERIVVVTHCVPFKEGLIRNNADPAVCFRNAFVGSQRFGKVIFKHPEVEFVLWGHVHKRQTLKKGDFKCINMSFDPAAENPVEIIM